MDNYFKNKILLLVTIVTLTNISFSQDKIQTIYTENKNSKQDDLVNGKSGYVIKLGKSYNLYTKDHQWKLKFFTSNNTLLWDVPVTPSKPLNYSNDFYLIGAPVGNYIYHLERVRRKLPLEEFPKPTKYIFTQIDSGGRVRSYEIEKAVKQTLATLASNKYIYQLVKTEQGKKTTESIIFYRYPHLNFQLDSINVDLPKLRDAETSSFWKYFGHKNDSIFFYSKTSTGDNIHYDISIVNEMGSTIKTLSIQVLLTNAYDRPAYHVFDNRHAKVFSGDFFYINNQGWAKATSEAYGSIQLDEQGENIFIYGLSGPKPFTKIAAVNDGFYVVKSDIVGRIKFSQQIKFPDEMQSDKFMRIHASDVNRNIQLRIHGDSSFDFYTWTYNKTYFFSFSNGGELTLFKADYGEDEIKPQNSSLINYLKEYKSNLQNTCTLKYMKTFEGEILYEGCINYIRLLFFKN